MFEHVKIDHYRPGDEVGICALVAAAFDHETNLDLEMWRWKFASSPVDSRPLIIVARDGDKIVGHYAAIGKRLRYHGEDLVIAEAVDVAVEEAYRGGRTGVLARMFEVVESNFRAANVHVAYGFPNRRHYVVGQRMLGYKDAAEVVSLFYLLSGRKLAGKVAKSDKLGSVSDRLTRPAIRKVLHRKVGGAAGVDFRWVDAIDERIDALWARVRDRYRIAVERDAEFVSWRYLTKPGVEYRLLIAERGSDVCGLAVVRHEITGTSRIGYIMECLVADDDHVFDGLISLALLWFSEEDVDYAVVRTAAEDPLRPAWKEFGFSQREGPFDLKLVSRVYSDRVNPPDLQDPARWLLSFGDGDVP